MTETPDPEKRKPVFRIHPVQKPASEPADRASDDRGDEHRHLLPVPVTDLSPHLKELSELAWVFLNVQGYASVTQSDLLEMMTATLPELGQITDKSSLIAALMARIGVACNLRRIGTPQPDHWPALARTHDGELILILAQQGSLLTVYDPAGPDQMRTDEMSELKPLLDGRILMLVPGVEHLAERHIDQRPTRHWFWSAFAGQRRALAEIVTGTFIANILALGVALFAMQVYDRVIPNQSEATLWVLTGGVIMALIFEAALRVARARLVDVAGRRIELSLSQMLMRKLLGMRADAPGAKAPGMLFNAMREFGAVREFFTASSISALADLPFILLFLFLVWTIGGPVVAVLLVGGVLMVLPSILFRNRMVEITRDMQGANSSAARLLHETIYERETLTATRAAPRFNRIWQELNLVSTHGASRHRNLSSFLTFWAQGVQQATYVATVVAGAYFVFSGDFTVGTIIAIGILTSRTLGPLTQLAAIMARWSNVRTALEGLEMIAGAPQDRAEGRAYLRREKLSGNYELRNVTFGHDPDAPPVLSLPGLKLSAGQTVALLGANGSGKTTLLRGLAGLISPLQGELLVDGLEIGQIDPDDLRRNIGYLSQEVHLFSGSLRENLIPGQPDRDDDRLYKALEFAGMGPFIRTHPRGLDLEITDGGAGLSVGQRQSIGWARLWLQDPAIVLLDEPTSALDQVLENTLVSRLENWLEGRTAVIATHRPQILSLVERTLILQKGQVAVDGPREAVLEHLARAQLAGQGRGGQRA